MHFTPNLGRKKNRKRECFFEKKQKQSKKGAISASTQCTKTNYPQQSASTFVQCIHQARHAYNYA